jgi:hypothetical protein
VFGTFCLLVSPKLLLQKNQYGLFRVSCRQDGKSTRKFLSIVCFLCHIRRAQYSPEWEEIQRGSDPSYAIRVGICSQVDWSTDLRRNIKQCCNCWITFTCSQKHHTHNCYEKLLKGYTIPGSTDIFRSWYTRATLVETNDTTLLLLFTETGKNWMRSVKEGGCICSHAASNNCIWLPAKRLHIYANWAEGKYEYSKHKNTELDWSKHWWCSEPG